MGKAQFRHRMCLFSKSLEETIHLALLAASRRTDSRPGTARTGARAWDRILKSDSLPTGSVQTLVCLGKFIDQCSCKE